MEVTSKNTEFRSFRKFENSDQKAFVFIDSNLNKKHPSSSSKLSG